MNKNVAKVIAFAVLVLAFAFYLHGNVKPVKASFPHNVTGQAWSSNIGWISFSCDTPTPGTCNTVDYGVDISPSNAITGQAWSNNIGWINFDPSYTGPTGNGTPPTYIPSTGALTGWARVCGGMDNLALNQSSANNACSNSAGTRTDGWDGWISLSGTAADNSTYGAKFALVGGQGLGRAWGSDVVGWIDFSGVKYNTQPPTASVTLSGPATVASGAPFNLNWTTNNVTASGCTQTSSPSNSTWNTPAISPLSGGSRSVSITSATTFTLTCTAVANAIPTNPSASVTVSVALSGTPIVNTVGASPSVNSATVAGSVNYNGYLNSPLALYFEWGPTASLGQMVTGSPSTTSATANFSGSISGLAASTPYYYRAVAKYPALCKSCIYAYFYGPIRTFTTSAPALPTITLSPACYQNQGYVIFSSAQNIAGASPCSGSAPWTSVPGTLPNASTVFPNGTYSLTLTCTDSSTGITTLPSSATISTPCVGPVGPVPPKPKAKPKFEEF